MTNLKKMGILLSSQINMRKREAKAPQTDKLLRIHVTLSGPSICDPLKSSKLIQSYTNKYPLSHYKNPNIIHEIHMMFIHIPKCITCVTRLVGSTLKSPVSCLPLQWYKRMIEILLKQANNNGKVKQWECKTQGPLFPETYTYLADFKAFNGPHACQLFTCWNVKSLHSQGKLIMLEEIRWENKPVSTKPAATAHLLWKMMHFWKVYLLQGIPSTGEM